MFHNHIFRCLFAKSSQHVDTVKKIKDKFNQSSHWSLLSIVEHWHFKIKPVATQCPAFPAYGNMDNLHAIQISHHPRAWSTKIWEKNCFWLLASSEE